MSYPYFRGGGVWHKASGAGGGGVQPRRQAPTRHRTGNCEKLPLMTSTELAPELKSSQVKSSQVAPELTYK